MNIREATPGDAEALGALARTTYAEAFGATMHPDDLAAHLERELSPKRFQEMLGEYAFLVAETDGELVGVVQFGQAELDAAWLTEPVELRPDDGYLERLYVRAAHQNRGVGTALLRAALEHLRLCDCHTVFLDVWAENAGAVRFYARHGFVKVGALPFYAASTGEKVGTDDLMARSGAKGA